MELTDIYGNPITHGSMCSGGVDGMAEGAKREGIETIWNCEIDEWNRRLLKQLYPSAVQYSDVYGPLPDKTPTVVSITAECQDLSISNTTAKGIYGERSKTIIQCVRNCGSLGPAYITLENSAKILTRGWEVVLYELAQAGYNAEWVSLPLTSFGVQQHRERLYCIAYTTEIGLQRNRDKAILRESLLPREFKRVAPGWVDRWAVPSPRNIRSTHGFTDYVHRIKALGNMIHPRPAQWMFRCILADIAEIKQTQLQEAQYEHR
jgi:DNA (cytosine-5)-methyltransferase 1